MRAQRSVRSQGGRLGHARPYARRTRHCRTHRGDPAAAGLIHHSDRGGQYAAGDYRDILHTAVIIQSMSRKANYWDNAPMESFFGTLKTELEVIASVVI
jgi:putative transposase